jgi:hypothetical protein
VEFGTANADLKGDASNRLAIGAGQPRRSADADAFAKGRDDFNLFGLRENVHGLDPCLRIGPKPDSGKTAWNLLCLPEWSFASGLDPGVGDPGPGCFQQHGPTGSLVRGVGFGPTFPPGLRRGVLPLDEPRETEANCEAVSLVLSDAWEAASPFSSPPLLG